MKEEKTRTKPENLNAELAAAEKSFDAFSDNIKELTMDRMNMAPRHDVAPQTQLSQKELDKSKDIYLKPKRTFPCRNKFNEKLRADYEFRKEYVQFIAENREIQGEKITLWTKEYPGVPAEEWEVPVNKKVWGPRYLAERIKGCAYHRMRMEDRPMSSEGGMQFYGQMVVDNIEQRLDAIPIGSRKSIFMGSSS